MVKTWRPSDWNNPYKRTIPDNIVGSFRVVMTEIDAERSEQYEAGADAMLQALRKMRDEKNKEYNIKSPLGFIPDD